MSITMKQKQILEFIHRFLDEKGVPPSIQEIGGAVGLSSSSSVHHQLRNMERMGLIRRNPSKSRFIEILERRIAQRTSGESDEHEALKAVDEQETPAAAEELEASQGSGGHEACREVHRYPLVQFNQCPETAESREVVMKEFPLSVDLIGHRDVFLIEMAGDSMKEAGILDGDLCIAKRLDTPEEGDIVVADIDGNITIKRLYRGSGYYRLEPENHRLRPIIVRDVRFLGKVIGILRNMERNTQEIVSGLS